MASRSQSRFAFWLFALFLVTVAGATVSWFIGADLVRERIHMIARGTVTTGGSFTARSIEVTGFPFTFDAAVTGLRLSGRTPRGVWQWQASGFKARLSPWRSTAVNFDLSGTHKLRFRVGRRPLDLEIKMGQAEGVFHEASSGGPNVLKLEPKKITIRETVSRQQIDAEEGSLQVYRTAEKKTADSDTSAGLLISFKGVTLPKAAEKLLGRKMPRLEAEIQVLGALPIPLDRQRLIRWRRDGGTLEIKNLDFAWGPAKIKASGTLGLDDGLQPEASFVTAITGYQKTVDALVAAGVVRERVARGVKLVLDMMARRSRPGQEATVRVPVSVQNRVIYVGPARLTRLPLLRW
jgi:hypothetical protein